MSKAIKNSRLGQLKRSFLGVASVVSAFLAWGFLSSATSASPQPASLATLTGGSSAAKVSANDEKERELILENNIKASKAKIGQQESNVILNDPFVQTKWGLQKTNAQRAWEITQGSRDIVIAVIDTGIDVNHKDLAANLWTNPGEKGVVNSDFCRQEDHRTLSECEKATNGIDDDGNGFIDDVHGWNFVHNNGNLTDNHGHGTHIAGIVGASSGNDFGISGVAPNVSLMILKYYDPKAANTNNLKNTIDSIRYAVKMKERLGIKNLIINYSGGGTDYSADEFAAIKDAERAGILFVAAAGNERSNSDEPGKHYYPADYDLTNIISVTAVSKEETKVLPSSNYGVRTVDLAAPGENIYSTLPNNSFGYMTGTSQATAFVTGVAALIMAHQPEFNAADVRKYILSTGDEYATLLSKTGTAKLLNSYKALTMLDKGVSFNGVVASNTARMGSRAFSSDANLKDPRINTSALNVDDTEEPAETIAMFGKQFLKALRNNDTAVAEAPESIP